MCISLEMQLSLKTMDEIIREVKRRNVMKATRLQMQRNGVKSDSLSEFEKTMPKKITMGYDEL